MEIYRGGGVFITLQLVGLGIVGFFPPLVNYLPTQSFLTAETAPPPKNPRLQACIEEQLFEIYDGEGDSLRAGIRSMMERDLSYLPEARRSAMEKGLDLALATFDQLADVRSTDAALTDYVESYQPLHVEVRGIQADIREHRREIEELERVLSRNTSTVAERAELTRDVAILRHELGQLETRIPADWKSARERYVALSDAEVAARQAYRRTVDSAYEPVQAILAEIGDADALAALAGQIDGLEAAERTQGAEAASEAISAAYGALSGVAGTSDIRDALTEARRALRKQVPEPDTALTELAKAKAVFAAEVSWRRTAAQELAGPLAEYDALIRDSIGVRQLDRLPSALAGPVAGCLANHQDISLHF